MGECFICRVYGGVPMECACRTTFAHVRCLVSYARVRAEMSASLEARAEAWSVCDTCKQTFHGDAHLVLSEEWVMSSYDSVERTLAKNRHLMALIERGQYASAVRFQRALLIESVRLHGAEHQATLITSGNLALALSRNDELKPAEQIQRELLCVRMRLFGPLHTSTLTVQGNLATTLMRRGKLEESEAMERLVHRGRTETLGAESSGALVSAGNLALVLSMRGKGAEAAVLMLATWRVQKRVLGRAHPDTVATRASLRAIVSAW
jgi:hypothetical protein